MKKFTKQDLIAGYLVKTREGTLYMVMESINGRIFISAGCSYLYASHYSTSLLNTIPNTEYDIMEVYGYSTWASDALKFSTVARPLLWKREEPLPIVNLTLEDIAKLQGCKVEQLRIQEKKE